MKKKIISTLGVAGSLSTVALFAVSCGTSESKLDSSLIADAQKDGETIGEIAFKKFMDELVADNRTDTAKKIQDIIKKSARWLYRREVTGSEFIKRIREDQMTEKEIKKADIQSLDTIDEIEDRVSAEFEDQKEAFKNQHGHGYEEAWSKELSSNAAYGNASSDKQAIDNMVTKQINNMAYNRYRMTQDSSTFTKEDVERGNPAKKDPKQKDWEWLWNLKKAGFVYSSDKTSTYDQLEEKQNVIVVSTGSFDVNLKNPSEIIGGPGKNGYLNKFDPIVVNHFLLPAIPDEKKTLSPWKVKLEDVKKWLISTKATGNAEASMNSIQNFKGLTYKKVKNKKETFDVSDEDKMLLKTTSGNKPGTVKTGGSLGMMDKLAYIKTMDPGFGFPLLNEEMKVGQFNVSNTNPLDKLSEKILNALQKSIDGNTWSGDNTNSETWANSLISLFDNIDDAQAIKIIGTEFKKAFGDSQHKWKRHVAYKIPQSGTTIVLSKFGVHVISEKTIDSKDEIIAMLKSDVVRKTKDELPYFKVIAELSKYSSDKMMILKSLLENKSFVDWLKTQPNYNGFADGNDYPDYTQKDIDYLKNKAIKGYENTLVTARVQEIKGTLGAWIDNAYMNETLIAGGTKLDPENPIWTNSMKNIYDTAIEIAKEGAVK